MKQLWSFVSALALVVLLGATASAHHSAVQYDFGKTATITGVVLKFQAINPHMRLTLRVTDEKGTREVELEGHSTNNMYRAGYRDGMIKYGDKITVSVAGRRRGAGRGDKIEAVTAHPPPAKRRRGRLHDCRHAARRPAIRRAVGRRARPRTREGGRQAVKKPRWPKAQGPGSQVFR